MCSVIDNCINVCFICKACNQLFQNVSDFMKHKNANHFEEIQKTKCIIFEERNLLNVDGIVDGNSSLWSSKTTPIKEETQEFQNFTNNNQWPILQNNQATFSHLQYSQICNPGNFITIDSQRSEKDKHCNHDFVPNNYFENIYDSNFEQEQQSFPQQNVNPSCAQEDIKILKCTEVPNNDEHFETNFQSENNFSNYFTNGSNQQQIELDSDSCRPPNLNFAHESFKLQENKFTEHILSPVVTDDDISLKIQLEYQSSFNEEARRNRNPNPAHFRTRKCLTKCFKCKFCELSFFRKDFLTSHLKIHSDANPFKCLELNCDQMFRTKAKLKEHLAVSHSCADQKQLFICPVLNCKKAFKIKSNLRRHISFHSDSTCDFKLFTCRKANCKLTFEKLKDIEAHL